ncbi:MAG: hemerythrin domain-containing protein [Chitinophagaceae bacterium]
MPRFNIFNQIHKSLRVLMYDTALMIGRTDFDNAEQYSTVAKQIRETVDAFDGHAHHEDESLLPLIQRYEPAVVDAFEQEHVTDHALSQKLRESLMALDLAVSPAAKRQLGVLLMHSFIEFMVFNLNHMYKEETVLNNILWQYYSDEELVDTNKKIVAGIPQEKMNFSAQWMMRALSNAEITGWLRNVERNAPAHVFRPLLTAAERELEQVRFRQVLEGLNEGVKIAS